MSGPSKELSEVEVALSMVIESLIDAQEGFRKIGEELKDETFRLYFLAESLQRAQFRGDLETVLHQEGVHDIREHGTAKGTILRAWAEVKAKFGGSDHTLLETAEQAEDAAKAAYADALNRDMPFPIRQLLETQAAHIQASHDYVKAARDEGKLQR